MSGAATAEKLQEPQSLEDIGLELIREYQDSHVNKAANLAIKITAAGSAAVGVVASLLYMKFAPPVLDHQIKDALFMAKCAGGALGVTALVAGASKGIAYSLNRSRNSNNDGEDVRYVPIHSDISAHFDEFGGFTPESSSLGEEDYIDTVLSDTVAQDAFKMLSPDHQDAVLLDMLHHRLSIGKTHSIDTFRNYIGSSNHGAIDLLVQKVIDECPDDQLPQYHDLLQGEQVVRAADHYLSTNDTQSAWRLVKEGKFSTGYHKTLYTVWIIDQFIEQGEYTAAGNLLSGHDVLPAIYKRKPDGTTTKEETITTYDSLKRVADGFIKDGHLSNATTLTTGKLFRKVIPYNERKEYRQTLFDKSETSPEKEQIRRRLYKEAI